MADPRAALLETLLAEYVDPHLESDLISAGALKSLRLEGNTVHLHLALPYPAARWRESLQAELRRRLREGLAEPDLALELSLEGGVIAHAVQTGLKPMPGIRNIIAVASGKGGVGKSTTTANLALALAAEGARVGVLDADIYGPSQPRMLGLSGKPESRDGQSLEPKIGHGVQVMSIGFLIDEATPMVWRGPMVTQALTQLLNDTRWQDLDFLLVDMPPGTGDTQLTLSQKVPVSGAIIVTTPQDIALLDARKGLEMFNKVKVPVLGIVENMALHRCSQCGHVEHIFGTGGGEAMAAETGVPLLGSLPLELGIREQADSGTPTVVAAPDSEAAACYRSIARKAAARLAAQAKDYSSKFPKIVIE